MRRKTLLLLLIILVGSFFLRSFQLADVGLQVGNETKNYKGPAKIATHIRWWALYGEGNAPAEVRQNTLRNQIANVGARGGFIHPTKPFFAILTSIFFLVVGASTYHFLLLNAGLGALTVFLVFWLARKVWQQNDVISLFAALALALSGFHLIWSRSGFAHVAGTFFLVLGLTCYLKAIWETQRGSLGWFVASGFALGAGVTSHPIVAAYVGVCFLSEVYRIVRGLGIRRGVFNILLLGLPLLSVILIMEMLIWSTEWLLLPDYSWLYGDKISSYISGILIDKSTVVDHLGIKVTWAWQLSGLFWMPFLYGEGILVTLLIFLGFCATVLGFIRTRSTQEFFLLAGILLPIALMIISDLKPFARNMAPSTLFLSLLAGRGLFVLWKYDRVKLVRWGLIPIFVLIQFFHIEYLFGVRSGYLTAANWFKEVKGEALVVQAPRRDRWAANGIRNVYYNVKNTTEKGIIDVVDVTWDRPEKLSIHRRGLYVGLVGEDYSAQKERKSGLWLDLVDLETPVGRFPNTDPFTAKKIRLANWASWVGTKARLPFLVEFANRKLKNAKEIERIWSLRVYKFKPTSADDV